VRQPEEACLRQAQARLLLLKLRRSDAHRRSGAAEADALAVGNGHVRKRQQALGGVAARAEQLAESGSIQGRSWTLAQICEHLSLSIENTVRGSAAQPVPKAWQSLTFVQRIRRWCIKRAMLLTGWFPENAPAPDSVQPSAAMTQDSALSRLRAATEAFDRKCHTCDASWGYHSLLGRMSGRAWRRFHQIHAAHHLSFLRPAQDTRP